MLYKTWQCLVGRLNFPFLDSISVCSNAHDQNTVPKGVNKYKTQCVVVSLEVINFLSCVW